MVQLKKSDASSHFYKAIVNKKLVPSKFQRVFDFVCDLCKNQIRQRTKQKKSRRELSLWLWTIRVNEDVIDNINYAVQDVHVICATMGGNLPYVIFSWKFEYSCNTNILLCINILIVLKVIKS